MAQLEVAHIELHRAKKLLKELAANPFVACIFGDSEVTIFVKGMSTEELKELRETLLAQIERELAEEA